MPGAQPDVLIVGAGALGLCTAAALVERGADVVVLDAGEGRNASAAAAGMIAPAFEAGLEDATQDRADLYRAARNLWPDMAERLGLDLDRTGADWRGQDGALARRLRALGFAVEDRADGFHTHEDWLIDPVAALDRLRAFVGAHGGRLASARATRIETADGGVWVESTAGLWRARAVVLACGWRNGALTAPDLQPALDQIEPIKGQLLELEGPGVDTITRVTRAPGAYLVPRAGRLLVGATMQPGRGDLWIEAERIEDLRRAAVAAVPARAAARIAATRAGVRGTSPDGLPLVGQVAPGLVSALAPRRNGWLLGPLVGRIAAAAVLGEDPGAWAEPLRPDRFVS
jgi:glycine oxidase